MKKFLSVTDDNITFTDDFSEVYLFSDEEQAVELRLALAPLFLTKGVYYSEVPEGWFIFSE